MEHIASIPAVGWVVIGVIAVLVFILLLVAVRKGIRFGWGNKIVSVGKALDKKLDDFKAEVDLRDKNRMKDEEARKTLFRKSGEIDEKLKADERRVVRRLYEPIKNIFKMYIKCEMPGLTAAEIIKDELNERVDYNNMRERLNAKERGGYVSDILFNIETDYKAFLSKIPRLPCGTEAYPEWSVIKADVEKIINRWADEMIEVITGRINEKIEMYMSEKDNFILPEYRELCIDFPIRKNKRYIKNLS